MSEQPGKETPEKRSQGDKNQGQQDKNQGQDKNQPPTKQPGQEQKDKDRR